jgi:hypothetical protein
MILTYSFSPILNYLAAYQQYRYFIFLQNQKEERDHQT